MWSNDKQIPNCIQSTELLLSIAQEENIKSSKKKSWQLSIIHNTTRKLCMDGNWLNGKRNWIHSHTCAMHISNAYTNQGLCTFYDHWGSTHLLYFHKQDFHKLTLSDECMYVGTRDQLHWATMYITITYSMQVPKQPVRSNLCTTKCAKIMLYAHVYATSYVS